MKRSRSEITFNIFNYGMLAILGMVTLYPFAYLIAISFNDSLDSLRGEVYLWPHIFTLENYQLVFYTDGLLGSSLRSLVRTVLGTILSVIGTSMLAYTLSRREFMLRKFFNIVLVISMYVNGGIIPTYLLIKSVGLTNSFWVYIIPGLIGVFNVIIIRSYFEQLPEGLVESAKIDGAGEFQTYARIIMPVSLPVLATITLFISVWHWNSWFDNYLYNTRDNLNLLQYELVKILIQSTSSISSGASGYVDQSSLKQITPQSIRATLTVVVTLPILFVYPFLQNFFIKGMMVGSMKE